MAVLRLGLVIDARVLEELKQALVNSPKRFYQVVNEKILPVVQARLNDTLNKDAGPVVIPFQFATPKSRRYYFAHFKPPYKRTGNVRQWRIILKAFTGAVVELIIENAAAYAQYVFGDPQGLHQSPGHRNTGYVLVAKAAPALVEFVLGNLSSAWVEILETEADAV